jgi:hypothetical protein
MLRAFFDGPDRTLSRAVLDVPDEPRTLDLGGSGRAEQEVQQRRA